ncbi:MAG: T9SS type A sorting domain-containing protein [bacterium]
MRKNHAIRSTSTAQFNEVDLNLDGVRDLVGLDRHGDRILCFITNQVYNQIDYSFKPEYEKLLPKLYDWAIFRDYNGDGRNDIFTYSPGWPGMMVYKNISEDVLKFELVVYPYLETYQESGYVNLLVTDVDYPAIEDIDFDGDLDIITFWVLGSFATYHRNLSMEKYGHADSLDYELHEYCWGRFAESDESNDLYFDTCFLQETPYAPVSRDERHTGSTLLMMDLDKDTVYDLILGDIDFPGLFALHNSGNKYNAEILSADREWPGSDPIRLFSFPAPAYIDVNNNGVKDMIVSPFDPTGLQSENKWSVWLYLNTGANNKPFFSLNQRNFLQAEMIDLGAGAYPVLHDVDGDNLTDMVVGNYGSFRYAYYENYELKVVNQSKLSYFRNTGTQQAPSFRLWDANFAGLDGLGKIALVPAFMDMDGDGLTDLLAGDSTGRLIYARNKGDNEFEVVTENYADINVGYFSAPQLFDLDKDGLKDLVIGEQDGNLNYYRNAGSASSPSFVFVTDSLGGINVTDYNVSWHGYSTPFFFRLPSGETNLVVGSEQGQLFHFTDIDGNLDGKFTLSDKLGELLDTVGVDFDRGERTAAVLADLSGGGNLTMIAGNYAGGLEYFNGEAPVLPGMAEQFIRKETIQCYPNPASGHTRLILDSKDVVMEVEIINLTGKVVHKVSMEEKSGGIVQLDLTGIPSGLYILRAYAERTLYTGKLMVK